MSVFLTVFLLGKIDGEHRKERCGSHDIEYDETHEDRRHLGSALPLGN